MIGKILFYIIAIALFVIAFLKIMRKNELLYLITLILQAIGIILDIILLIVGSKEIGFINILTILLSIVIPIFILICEYYKIDLNERLCILLAKFYLFRKENKKAKKILISLIEKKENSKDAHKMLAMIYEEEGGLRKAIDEYVRVVDLDSNAYDSYYKIAVLLKELGNDKDSQEMLTKLVNKRPDYIEACIALSDLLCSQDRYKEALNIMNETARHNPNSFDVFYNLGMIYTMLNDFSSAKECYEKAAIINSLEYNTSYNIATIELIIGELETSEKYYSKCIDDEELGSLAYYQLAKIYLKKGDKDTAIQALNIAIELDNNLYKKAMDESAFIPIKGYINYPNIDEEDIEIKKIKSSQKEIKVREHLENTYSLVGKLNNKEIGVRYGNNTKEKAEEEMQIEN